MKAIHFRYMAIISSIVCLALLWEFWLEDLTVYYLFPGAKIESFGERVEYIATVFIFSCVSLIYPYLHARRNERKHIEMELEQELLIAQLQASLSEIKTLHGIIPICSYCKKIRDDHDVWTPLEVYLDQHSDAKLSHGFCPDCFERQMLKIDQSPNKDYP